MPRESKITTLSIHKDSREEVNGVLDELKRRKMSKSATICQLLIDFAKGGYKFREVE